MKRMILGVAALGLTGAVAAHGGAKPEDAVHYRQGIMMGMAWNVGPMGAMVKGDVDFDAGRFAFLAGRLAMLAPMSEEAFTPNTADTKSEAKPELWDNLDDFKQRMESLRKETAGLAEVAKGSDEAAMKAAFGDTVKVCKGCHDEYQKEH